MTKKALTLVFPSLLTLALTVFFSSAVLAVGVKPLRTELAINPGSSATATILVINSENIPITAQPEVTVYTKNDSEGYPVVENIGVDHPLNITDWIEFGTEAISIEPNSEKEVTFTVNVPADAQPGGRYASIMYVAQDESGESGGVQVRTAVPSLILVKVNGEEKHSGSVSDFGIKDGKLFSDQPPTFAINFQNNGNVHERPIGDVVIKNTTGEQLTAVARYRDLATGEEVVADSAPFNLDGGNVLPGSSRVFNAKWNENIINGDFTATLNFDFASEGVITKEIPLKIEDKLTLNSFEISQLEDSTDFTVTVANNGNVYEKLAGLVEIKNEFDSVMASPVIPEDAGYIAPGSVATITIPWLEKQVPNGKFVAQLKANYGFAKLPLESEVQFSSDNVDYKLYAIIGGSSLAVILIVLAAIIFIKRKKQNLN